MKVALVTSFPAFPTTAGNRSRIRQLALAIRQLGHELTFVYLESKWEVSDDAAHEAAFGKANYVKLEKRRWAAKRLREAARGAVRRALQLAGVEAGYYSSLDRFRDRDFLQRLARLDLRPDVVLVEYVLDSWAFEAFPRSARRVLDTHDAFGDRHRAYVARGIRNYWVSLRPASENAGFRRADAVLAIQEHEAQRFRRQLASDPAPRDPQLAVVGHLLEPGEFEVNYEADNAAVFLASDNPANAHAIRHFIGNILPQVVSQVPAFELRLAGAICGAVGDAPGVRKLGVVDDVRAVFAQAPLSVNPMLAGTGLSIKLLEAMAAGVPTVSTETGARGLPQDLREGVVVVGDDDPSAFAAATVRLVRDAGLRREKGRAAREDARRWNAAQFAELDRSLAGA